MTGLTRIIFERDDDVGDETAGAFLQILDFR